VRAGVEEGTPDRLPERGRSNTSDVEFADGQIIAYDKNHRTARMCFIDYGLGFCQRRAFADIGRKRFTTSHSFTRKLLQRRELAGYEVSNFFMKSAPRRVSGN